MIVNTGLLPIKEGAACYRFPYNTFPALSELYKSSCDIIPGNLSVWNQRYMNIAYNIKDSYTVKSKDVLTGDDKLIFQQYSKIYDEYEYSMILTISTHTPFQSTSEKSSLILPKDMPEDMANYIKSFHYTDSCMKNVLDNIQTDSILRNSTIVITSDHSIFPQNKRDIFDKYCKENNLDYNIKENYCPLIIYSPKIKEKTIIDKIAYQMDIYPTILNLIDCENYYFKGFGIDLLNKEAYNNRPITEEEAFELSNKIIESNYFKNHKNSTTH